ncbi:MATE family efflux transporter [Spiroplasma endosymbiont of Asaphidion curtum]|uniref:MATE family efflux transporter n=1 Tax=Spiroplasma endosymbiont of Asaphidion curtum TaxID=3066281 RepID=UPI00313A81E1
MKTTINDNFKNDDESQLTKRETVIRNYNPWKAIFFMCLPTVIIMIIMSTYNLVDKFLALQFADSYVISTFLENNSLIEQNNLQMLARDIINVATQYSSSTIGLLTAFSLFIAIGTSTRFGIAYGERNNPLISRTIGNGISLMIIVAIVLTPILVFTNEPLIALQSKNSQMTNPEVYKIALQLAVGYTKWFIFFLFFILLSNFLINLLRSEGQGFWATIIIFTSVIVNVVLDIVLMVYGKLGLEGAAIATVISWFWNIIFALLVIYLEPKSKLKIYWEDLKIEKTILYNIIAIGMTPLFINISVAVTSALSNFFVSKLSIELPRPGFTVPWVVQLFAGIAPWIGLTDSPLIGVSQGGRALLSYSYGAKDYQRIWDILKRIILVQFLILIITELIIAIFGNEMLTLFISNVDMTYRWYFLLSYLVYPTVVVPYIGIIFYQSISRPKMSLFFSALRSIIVFIPCIIIGYFVALVTKNAHYYFLFLGLVAPISALITIPILIMTWKKYRSYLKLDSAKKVRKSSRIFTKLFKK